MAEHNVILNDVSKIYKSTVKVGGKRRRQKVTALKSVSLACEKGESIGVLGQNGSGKSTLMNIIGGQEAPTEGSVYVNSTPSLLGVSAALIGHLSGADNIRIGCLAKGMSPDRLESAVEDVARFCDIGDAIHRPMNTYSSGMAARLRFGIATTMRPDILLVDEGLSTGDAAFASRASERMEKFLADAGSLFVVSHIAKTIQDLCERSIWIHQGDLIADGATSEIGALYDDWVRHKAEGKDEGADRLIERIKSEFEPAELVIVGG